VAIAADAETAETSTNELDGDTSEAGEHRRTTELQVVAQADDAETAENFYIPGDRLCYFRAADINDEVPDCMMKSWLELLMQETGGNLQSSKIV
jgi:hypothetical protein